MGSSFEFTALAIPHIFMGMLIVAVAALAVLTRGSGIIRVALLLLSLSVIPYPVGMTINMTTTDPAIAHLASKGFVGSIALLGPSLMMLFLALAGRLERYRWLVLFAFGISASATIFTWSTDLVIQPESYVTPLGFYYHQVLPLELPVVGQLALWAIVGMWLAQRGNTAPRSQRQRTVAKRFAIMGVLAVTGLSDAMLSHKIGFYPFGVIPGSLGASLILIAIVKNDLLRSRGFDRAGAIEALILFGSFAASLVILWALQRVDVVRSPWLVVALIAPIVLVGQAAMLLVRRRYTEHVEEVVINSELEAFVAHTGRIERETQLVEPLATLLAGQGGLPEMTLLLTGEDGRLRPLGDTEATGHQVDARLRPWLIASPTLLVLDELPTMRLGGLRQPVESFMARLGTPVAMPLVDREQLVGFICGTLSDHRAMRDGEASVVSQAAAATAKALTYASLLREATDRIEVVKEVEVASAVQQARSAGEQRLRYASCEVISYYQPAPHFGGHWWSSHELADGRFLVVVGDVTGSGVPAALVSFTAEGACETAQRMYGANLDVISLLEALDASLRHVGSEYSMACFAALFDPSERQVTFANAGHPFPYVCRPQRSSSQGTSSVRASNGVKTELRSLVSRGTPLGAKELIVSARTFDLQDDDMVVFYSDSLTAGRSPEGDAYGDRRLQRVLRHKVVRAGEQATQVILNDASEFWGPRELEDDLNVIVVRVGAYS